MSHREAQCLHIEPRPFFAILHQLNNLEKALLLVLQTVVKHFNKANFINLTCIVKGMRLKRVIGFQLQYPLCV